MLLKLFKKSHKWCQRISIKFRTLMINVFRRSYNWRDLNFLELVESMFLVGSLVSPLFLSVYF